MFERVIYPAYNGAVVTKFEKKSWKSFLPKVVKQQIDNKYFNIFYIQQLFSCFIKNKEIEPLEKINFGEIKLSVRPRHQGEDIIDARLEENKTYYGWKVECRKVGSGYLNVVIILGELTEAMNVFKANQKKKINQ